MATAEEVAGAIEALAQRLVGADADPASVPERTIICVLPDLGTGFSATLRNARLVDIHEVPEDTQGDARISAKSDDLIAMIEGRLNIGLAFMLGKVRIDAPAQDLMMIRRLF